mmetsp:Transcript_44780/g.130413  ORF Transcript_44780/g.130413 Transcript_44780/m.130413 type:complete len:122 (+) Transcript_44780:59-424(+)
MSPSADKADADGGVPAQVGCTSCWVHEVEPPRRTQYAVRQGGSYKKTVTYELVGEGHGDFDELEEEPSACSRWKIWVLVLVAVALFAVALTMLFSEVVFSGRQVKDANAMNATNATRPLEP